MENPLVELSVIKCILTDCNMKQTSLFQDNQMVLQLNYKLS